MIALFGSLIGFLGSIVPEFFKFFNDKADKAHELAVLQLQMQNASSDRSARLDAIGITADVSESQALYSTYKTGVKWVDALNGTVRPVLTYAFFTLYALVKYLQYTMIGANAPLFHYVEILWNAEDQAIFAGIISFYFGQRAMAKIRGR